MDSTILSSSNLSIGYKSKKDENVIAKDLNLNLGAGKLTALIGANGVGKSTLLNLMGEKKAHLYAIKLKKKILRNLEKHGKKAKELISTIEFILERQF